MSSVSKHLFHAALALAACGGQAPSAPASEMVTGPSSEAPSQLATAGMSKPAAAASSAGSAAAMSSNPSTASPTSTPSTGSTAGAGRAAAAGASAATSSGAAGATGLAGAVGTAAPSGAAGASGAAANGSVAETPCPASNTLKAGDNRKTLMHGGRERRFSVYVPSSITGGMRVPLVLDFHGNGSTGAQEQSGSGWRQKADAEHFIVVYPDGIGNGWNVGNCCGEALMSMVDDVGFARAMVENVETEACIDAHRVYATGISNGAGLAHRLACEAADVFAAIAAASADLVTDPCKPARPISEISVRGLSDTLVAYEGGNTGSTGWYSPGAKGTLDLWKSIDGCMGSPTETLEYCETYTQCSAGVEVTLCSLPGTGHILYQNSLNFSVSDNAWEMFKRQTLP
ncbi:MAG TPA: PHB depolymerase family esterase [Polyangiales bacterium]|nr:PHB depolymerase family esterase [Polyangiales bacterium]